MLLQVYAVLQEVFRVHFVAICLLFRSQPERILHLVSSIALHELLHMISELLLHMLAKGIVLSLFPACSNLPFALQLVFCISLAESQLQFIHTKCFSHSSLPLCSIPPSKLVHSPALLVQPVPGHLFQFPTHFNFLTQS